MIRVAGSVRSARISSPRLRTEVARPASRPPGETATRVRRRHGVTSIYVWFRPAGRLRPCLTPQVGHRKSDFLDTSNDS